MHILKVVFQLRIDILNCFYNQLQVLEESRSSQSRNENNNADDMSGSSDDDRSAAVPSTCKGIKTTVCFDVVNRPPTVTPKKYALHL